MTEVTGTVHATPIRAIVVDDEELARQVLREFLAAHADVSVVAECANGFEAVKAVAELHPDLLLLDVQMPKLDGFDVLELIGDAVPVVFVTAFDSFALRAFEVNAVDYLMKPFGAERLAAALDRVRERMRSKQVQPLRAVVSAVRTAGAPLSRILIRDRADVHVIPVEKVDYIESQDDYVAIRSGGRSFLKEQTLGELERLLSPDRFIRIHRRYLLNITRLAKIEQSVTESRVAILHDGTALPISKSGYARLREIL
jgi:two-component system, LytTR family, response regulator